ncbi:hypothetical protein [uncultured Sulfitobacter sp.]|uniref:hypothetical protein n=1 Tax=uncultured Sulfitobacter sp. TaxID=191468 RepID=UPI002604A4DF|nr:hypothetical protein [uncultured Sulfitobacter sp.]
MSAITRLTKRIIVFVILIIIITLYIASSVSSQAENKSFPKIELPIRIIFEFKSDGTREYLHKLDAGKFFSLEKPVKFSDADMIIYKVNGWNASDSVPNAESIRPLVERAKGSHHESITNMMVVEVGGGRSMAFLFVNTASRKLNAECFAKLIYASIVDIDPEWDDDSEAFRFNVNNC